jgi:hypothetical protein
MQANVKNLPLLFKLLRKENYFLKQNNYSTLQFYIIYIYREREREREIRHNNSTNGGNELKCTVTLFY